MQARAWVKTWMIVGALCAFSAGCSSADCYDSYDEIENALPLIQSYDISSNILTIIPDKAFEDEYLAQDIFFAEYNTDVDLAVLDESILIIPFLAAVSTVIMQSGQTYYVESLDYDYYQSLEVIRKVFQLFYPELEWSGRVVAKKLVKNERGSVQRDRKIALLFSGGLDAVASSFAHFDEKQLLITICGTDMRPDQVTMWYEVKKQALDYAKRYGHRNAFIRSNFAYILRHDRLCDRARQIPAWWAGTLQGLSYTGVAIPLVVAHGSDDLYMASTRTLEYPFPYGTHPAIENSIEFAGYRVFHDGAEYDRLDKIRVIADVCQKYEIAPPQLRVCWGKDERGGNCGKCEKCLRTINELLVENQSPLAWGFKVTLEDITQTTKNYFDRKISMKSGLRWHWGCIVNRLNYYFETEKRSGKPLYAPALRTYLEWLSLRNFDALGLDQERDILYSEQRPVMSFLWNAGVNRSLKSFFGQPK